MVQRDKTAGSRTQVRLLRGVSPLFGPLFGPLLLLCCFAGCDEESSSVLLKIAGAGHAPPGELVLAYVHGETRERLLCPGGAATRHLSCDPAGVLVQNSAARPEVTVKARGYSFVTRQLSLKDLPGESGRRVAEFVLSALPQFEQNADYATGFAAEGGLEAFRDMAYLVDTELGPSRVVKFYIHDVKTSPQVFFQNTKKHPLHYGFVSTVLGKPYTITEFEKRTYHGQDREAMAGTVVQYVSVESDNQSLGQPMTAPITVNYFPSDDLRPAQAELASRLLEERLGFASLVGGRQRVMYLPAGTLQEQQLDQELEYFFRRDTLWVKRAELYGSVTLQILNPGLAYGTLRRLSPEALQQAVVSYKDVLLLTRLPNALPIVGGTITEELQTPLAHVNVAARARGTPNIAWLEAAQDEKVKGLLGQLVRFEVKGGTFTLEASTLAEAEAFWSSRETEPITPAFDVDFTGLPGFAELGFSDSIRVGAKAANLAEISHVLQQRAAKGFAVPFHYYDRFMRTEQVNAALCDEARVDCTGEGRAAELCSRAWQLCQSLDGQPETLWDYMERVLDDPEFNSDTELREAALDGLRYHIRHVPLSAAFAALLDARVAAVFGAATVRLRSSTNAEDLPNFSGAGLYDSYSAGGPGGQPASSQVRKVWASVWNWRAFEERGFWSVDHRSVRMGVCVNQAFADEQANGVLITQNIADPSVAGMYVNVQQGEVPVTNPEGGTLPEVFSIIPSPAGLQVARLRFSSLSPAAPLLSDDEILALYKAADQVQRHLAPFYGVSPVVLTLDLEFKFHGPERQLIIKQARPYLQGPG